MASSRGGDAMDQSSKMSDEDEPMPEIDVAEFSQKALQSVMASIKMSNELVSGKEDFDFYNSFAGFQKVMNVEGRKVKQLMKSVLAQQGIKGKFDGLDLDDMFEVLVEANDVILERVGNTLDEVSGIKKVAEPVMLVTATTTNRRIINTGWNKGSSNQLGKSDSKFRLLAARNIIRPQLRFRDKIDNSANPFEPVLKEKPNALKPMSFILEKTEYGEMFSHPYQYELGRFEPPADALLRAPKQVPKSLDDTPYTFINTVEGVTELLNDLKSRKEFAVDLEHHSYRSYQGITCLMQISTRDKDYLIDTLDLRSDLQPLNEVFTNPKIVKVFHGADSDIEWLQRDLGLYVVNMFDTGQASRVLSFAHFSLAYLLKHYCNVDANKTYQLADWRIRPLPDEMVHYAREDTHYLLHIYDLIKNELLDKGNDNDNFLLSVFQRSKEVCEKRYVKPAFNPENYTILCTKSRKLFNSRQLSALRELYAWRDRIARQEDESTGYILPNHMLLQIAEVLPREMQGILACCNPIPSLVRQNLNEIHSIILQAREQSMVKPLGQELRIQVDKAMQQFDMDNVLNCPHDFRQTRDMDEGPTLLDIWSKHGDEFDVNKLFRNDKCDKVLLKSAPILTCLQGHPENVVLKNTTDANSRVPSFDNYASPFKRFSLVQPVDSRSAPKETLSAPPSTETLVSELKDHFLQLARIHGDSRTPSTATTEVNGDSMKPSTSTGDVAVATLVEPIRNTMEPRKKKKKRKKDDNVSQTPEIVQAVVLPNKKKKKGAPTIDLLSFEPFNYDDPSLVAKTTADGSGGTKGKKKKNKVFEPFKLVDALKGKNKGKSRSGNKSVTYSNKEQPDKISTMAWPKK